MRKSSRALVALAVAASSIACRKNTAPRPAEPVDAHVDDSELRFVDAARWNAWASADWVAFARRADLDALKPLFSLRESQGHVIAGIAVEDVYEKLGKGKPSADAIHVALERLARHTGGKLHFALLVGDVPNAKEKSEAIEGFVPVPTFYLPKMAYEEHDPKAHPHPLPFPYPSTEHDHSVGHTGELFPTDHPYSIVIPSKLAGQEKEADPMRLAIGRVPARSKEDVAAFAKKVVAYESDHASDAWRRRIYVTTGPANYGAMVDGIIESMASSMLDNDVSYDFDVDFMFPKIGSPYAYRFDRLEKKFVDDLHDGALIAAYVGHGASYSFEDVHFKGNYYEIATTNDANALSIDHGAPMYFSFACDTGAFDRPDGVESMAEAMILNPKGPIATFASSRESHPYPNALYGQAVISEFIDAQPKTIGDGVLAMEEKVGKSSIAIAKMLVDVDEDALKEEHYALYNLFGDPATKLAYPKHADVKLSGDVQGEKAKAGGKAKVALSVAAIDHGKAKITVETARSTIRGETSDASDLETMSLQDAFAKMEKDFAIASDKVVSTKTIDLVDGVASVEVDLPTKKGHYVVKAFVAGSDAAMGHAAFEIE